MNNIFEKRELMCINRPYFKMSTMFSPKQNLFKPVNYCIVNDQSYKLPLIKTFDDMDNKFSQICILNYKLFNDFDMTFMQIYNPIINQKFSHKIDNNTLLLPFEMKAVITIRDLEWNDLNYTVSLCFIPNKNDGSWYDIADGAKFIQVGITAYDLSFAYEQKKFSCITFIGAFNHQTQNSQLILYGGDKYQDLLTWCCVVPEQSVDVNCETPVDTSDAELIPQNVVKPKVLPQTEVKPKVLPQTLVKPKEVQQKPVEVKPKVLPQTVIKPKVTPQKVVKPKVLPQKVVKPKVLLQNVVKPKVNQQKPIPQKPFRPEAPEEIGKQSMIIRQKIVAPCIPEAIKPHFPRKALQKPFFKPEFDESRKPSIIVRQKIVAPESLPEKPVVNQLKNSLLVEKKDITSLVQNRLWTKVRRVEIKPFLNMPTQFLYNR